MKKCIVVGHSAHGLLALEYAKKYKEHVSGAVIIGMPPHMRPEYIAMAQSNWEESVWPERKAAFDRNMKLMPDEKLNQLPRDEWFLHMNFRNVPKSWYDYNFDSRPLWQGVKPNAHVLDQNERIVEDIAEYGQALLLTPDEGEDRAEMFKQFKGMFEPNGVLDIAFKTDAR